MNRPKCKRCRNKSSTLLRSRTITTDEYCCWECWRLDILILSVKVTLNPKLCVKCGRKMMVDFDNHICDRYLTDDEIIMLTKYRFEYRKYYNDTSTYSLDEISTYYPFYFRLYLSYISCNISEWKPWTMWPEEDRYNYSKKFKEITYEKLHKKILEGIADYKKDFELEYNIPYENKIPGEDINDNLADVIENFNKEGKVNWTIDDLKIEECLFDSTKYRIFQDIDVREECFCPYDCMVYINKENYDCVTRIPFWKYMEYDEEFSKISEEDYLSRKNKFLNNVSIIQKAWKQAYYNPKYKFCRDRLSREYDELF